MRSSSSESDGSGVDPAVASAPMLTFDSVTTGRDSSSAACVTVKVEVVVKVESGTSTVSRQKSEHRPYGDSVHDFQRLCSSTPDARPAASYVHSGAPTPRRRDSTLTRARLPGMRAASQPRRSMVRPTRASYSSVSESLFSAGSHGSAKPQMPRKIAVTYSANIESRHTRRRIATPWKSAPTSLDAPASPCSA